MPQPTRPFLGESAESRVQSRRAQLVDTGFELLAAEGWKNVSIHQLCLEAGLNKRYFYESFADLDELGGAVIDHLAQQLIDIGQAAVQAGLQQGLDTGGLAQAALQACVGWLVEDPRRARVLFSAGGDNAHAQSRRQEVIRKLAETLSLFSLDYHKAEEPHAIARVGSALLIGGSIEIIIGWLDGQLDVTLDELIEDIASFWVAVGNSAIELTKKRLEKKPKKAARKKP